MSSSLHEVNNGSNSFQSLNINPTARCVKLNMNGIGVIDINYHGNLASKLIKIHST